MKHKLNGATVGKIKITYCMRMVMYYLQKEMHHKDIFS